MRFKKLFTCSLMLGISYASQAQDIISANFKLADYAKGIAYVDLYLDKFRVTLDQNGNVSSIEPERQDRSDNWDDYEDNPNARAQRIGNLRVVYYDSFDSSKSGKIKSVDGIPFDYYGDFDIHDPKGRLKSIGKISIKYNNAFNIHDIEGSLKSVGNINVAYNNAFNIHDRAGTVKKVGAVNITYYNDFDDEKLRGKIKSIKGNTRSVHVTRISD